MNGPNATVLNWLLAAIPIVLLIATILKLKWSAPRAGGVAWLVAAGLALAAFGAAPDHVAIASAKGLTLAVFVLSIVWTSVFMYNMVDKLKGIDAIGGTVTRLVDDRLAQALLVGWGFSSFIQGVTGFGVPVAVAAPLLIMLGFPPARAAAMVLVGHGWAVTFGSMGASYYTIVLVSGIDGAVLGPHMALIFGPTIFASGLLVAHIQGGIDAVRRSFAVVLVLAALMTAAKYVLASVGAPQIASTAAAAIAMVGVAVLSRTALFARAGAVRDRGVEAQLRAQTGETAADAAAPHPNPLPQRGEGTGRTGAAGPVRMSFWLAALPYTLLITFSVVSQVPVLKALGNRLRLALDYPGFTTGQGFEVGAATAYAPVSLITHPGPLIIYAVLLSVPAFILAGRWRKGVAWDSMKLTYSQCMGTTVGVAMMVMMALVMADTGMTVLLARGIATASGPLFPMVSPFIGLLGSFMTGSNTNSNVMFGALQVETANALGIGAVTMASVQSLGASVGSCMAPAKVLVGAAIVGLSGKENEIFRMVIPYIVGLVAFAGVQALVLVLLFPALTR